MMPTKTSSKRQKKIERIVIEDVSVLKALADPMRLHVLVLLGDNARTVKEIASMLGVKPTRLYYHFNKLEEAGLIRVVDRRMVSGIEERTYEAVAESLGPGPESLASMVKDGFMGAFFNVVRAEIELAALANPVPIGEPGGPVPVLTLTNLRLTEAQVEEVKNRWVSIMEEFGGPEPDSEPNSRTYHFVFGGYLAPSELSEQ